MRSLFITLCACGSLFVLGPRCAQAQDEPPATGFTFWVRAAHSSLQDLAASAVGAPQFFLGHRGERFALGLGVGFTQARASDKSVSGGQVTSEDKATITSFQLGPSAFVDVWRSPDSRTHGGIVGGLGLGRLSVSDQSTFRDFSGNLITNKTTNAGTLLALQVGLGADHFLGPHFALGAEGGFQGTFALGIKEKGQVPTGNSSSLTANGAYGALRATIVF